MVVHVVLPIVEKGEKIGGTFVVRHFQVQGRGNYSRSVVYTTTAP